MEIKVNAIVTRAVDYKDNDKILTLYSLEKGKITANIKGVKKPKAKLKFASEPFCFAEFILAEKGGRYTVINASYLDSFYNLRLNLNKYYLSAVVTDVINNLIEENYTDAQLFSLVINAVKNICYNDDEKTVLAWFLYTIAEYLGYGINTLNCYDCSAIITGRVFFRYADASFSCQDCLVEGFAEITKDTYSALNTVALLNANSLSSVSIADEKVTKLLKFLFYYLSVKTDVKLKTGASLFEFLSGERNGLWRYLKI